MPRFTGQSIERVEDPRFLTGADRFVSAVALARDAAPRLRAEPARARPDPRRRRVGGVRGTRRRGGADRDRAGPVRLPPGRRRAARSQDPAGPPARERQGALRRRPGRARRRRDCRAGGRRARPRRRRLRAAACRGPHGRTRSTPVRRRCSTTSATTSSSTTRASGVRSTRCSRRADLVVSRQFTQHRISHVPLEGRGGVAVLPARHRPARVRDRGQAAALAAPRDVDAAGHPLRGHPCRGARHRRRVRSEGSGHTARTSSLCAAAKLLGASGEVGRGPRSRTCSRPAMRARRRSRSMRRSRDDGTILGPRRAHGRSTRARTRCSPFPTRCFALDRAHDDPGRVPLEPYALDARRRTRPTRRPTVAVPRPLGRRDAGVARALLDEIAGELGLEPVEVRRRQPGRLDGAAAQDADRPDARGVDGARDARATPSRSADLERVPGRAGARARAQGRLPRGRLLDLHRAGARARRTSAPSVGFDIAGERRGRAARARRPPDGDHDPGPHGQGHETTLAQVAATSSACRSSTSASVRRPRRPVSARWGPAGRARRRWRAAPALHATRAVKQKALAYAGDMLEIVAATSRSSTASGRRRGRPGPGRPARRRRADRVVHASPPDGEEPRPRSVALRLPRPRGGWSGGTHAASSRSTRDRRVRDPRYVVVEDCGALINPAIVDGQIRGRGRAGHRHGALRTPRLRRGRSTAHGDVRRLPRPRGVRAPDVEIEHLHPEPLPPGAIPFRGVGEGGFLGAPAAVTTRSRTRSLPSASRSPSSTCRPSASAS